EVQLWLIDRARLAGFGDLLAPFDVVATPHEQRVVMGVCRDPIVLVTDQHQIAVTLELTARVGNCSAFRRVHAGTLRDENVDAVVMRVVRPATESGDDPTANGPAEFAGNSGSRRFCRLRGKACIVE